MTAIDTNVLVDLLANVDAALQQRAYGVLEASARRGPLFIAPIVHAELGANPAFSIETFDRFLLESRIRVDWKLSEQIWRVAGMKFAHYARRRRASRGGEPRRLIADFVIGAHATAVGGLVTRDAAFYRREFADLAIFEP